MNLDKLKEDQDNFMSEYLKNDIATLERTSLFLFRIGMFDDPQDRVQYQEMLKHINKMKKTVSQ